MKKTHRTCSTLPLRIALVLITASVVGGAAAGAASPKRALSSEDIYRMEAVSEPQLSPDGQWIAYLVTTSDREADQVRTAIWMVSWDGTQHVQLTNAAESLDTPR